MTIIKNYLTTAMYQICFSILELHVYKSSAWEIKAYEISAFTRIEPYYRTEGAVDPYRNRSTILSPIIISYKRVWSEVEV